MLRKVLYAIIAILAFSLLEAYAVYAQEVAEDQDITAHIITIALASLAMMLVIAFTVGLLKHVKVLSGVPAKNFNLAVAVSLWVVIGVSTYLVYGIRSDNLFTIIAQVGPMFAGFIASLIGAPVIHEVAEKKDIPVIGYNRPVL